MRTIKKAQKGMTMVELKRKYPKSDTTAKGDTRFQDYSGAYRDEKMYQFVQDADAAFDRKYGKGKPAVDKKKGATKKKMKTGGAVKKGDLVAAGVAKKAKKAPMVDPKGAYTKVQQRTLGNMKKGGKMMSKKK